MKSSKPQFVGQKVKLSDICSIVSGATPKTTVKDYWGGDIKWITPSELNDDSHVIYNTAKHLTEAGFASARLRMFPEGTVLLTTRAPIGKVAIAGEPMCCNQGFKNLVCSDAVNNEYLYRYLKNRSSELQVLGRGATFKELSKKEVAAYEINLPPLKRQLEAVEKLALVDKQVVIAKTQLDKLDSLVKSRFVEIFGDFACYETKPLIKCVDCIEAGKSPKCLAFSRKMAEPGVLKLSAISSGVYCENENKALPRSVSLTIDKVVHANDILLSRKNTPELVGRSVLVKHTDGNIMFPDIIFRMHPLPPINAMYLSYLLAGPLLHSIQSLAHGSAKSMSNIPKSELAKLSIPIPALNLQNEFANFVSQVDKSRFSGMLHLLNSLSGIMHASFFSVADTD